LKNIFLHNTALYATEKRRDLRARNAENLPPVLTRSIGKTARAEEKCESSAKHAGNQKRSVHAADKKINPAGGINQHFSDDHHIFC